MFRDYNICFSQYTLCMRGLYKNFPRDKFSDNIQFGKSWQAFILNVV